LLPCHVGTSALGSRPSRPATAVQKPGFKRWPAPEGPKRQWRTATPLRPVRAWQDRKPQQDARDAVSSGSTSSGGKHQRDRRLGVLPKISRPAPIVPGIRSGGHLGQRPCATAHKGRTYESNRRRDRRSSYISHRPDIEGSAGSGAATRYRVQWNTLVSSPSSPV